MKTAYLDCFSGISGDMFLGALLDAGLPFEELERILATLPLKGYGLEAQKIGKQHLFGIRLAVSVDSGKHAHRGLKEIREIVEGGDLSTGVKHTIMDIFESIAREEGNIHNRPPGEVHFHEVGAVDSIIDIVGAVYGLEFLGITSLSASALPLGSGFVETRHGRIPLPAPATIALLKDVPVYDSGLEYEMVTPTGAALVKGLAHSFGSMPPMMVETVGYGAGTRDLPDRPNLLRILVGREHLEKQVETVVLLEANLDDMNPEWMGFLMERLLEAGALDVIFCPVQMKKNRPGVLLQVMGRPHQREELMEILFREATTLGIRFRYSQRTTLRGEAIEIESPWGTLSVKKVLGQKGSTTVMPEYEACQRIAREKGIPLREIYHWVNSQNLS